MGTVRPWRTPRLPELVGANEAQQILGIAGSTLYDWIRRGFMLTPRQIAAGPVWVRTDVDQFAADVRRQLDAGVSRRRLVRPVYPWRTERLPDLAGVLEATEILQCNRTSLYRWMKPGSGTHGQDMTFMVPSMHISSGPVWVKSDLERFALARSRVSSGREAAVVKLQAWPWRTPRLPELVGLAEAAELLDVTVDQLHDWLRPGSGDRGPDRTFMVPPRWISYGPIWARRDVERFRQLKAADEAADEAAEAAASD